MLLSITTTHAPATDLGYLIHKHPDRVQSFDLTFGQAHVFYPEASPTRCTAALLLEIDPIHLVRGRRGPAGDGFALDQYVNDRPYVSSSFLSVAIAEVFGTALSGRCAERPALADARLPFEVCLSALPCRGGESLLRSLFEPLGYSVEAQPHALDPKFPDWGPSPYLSVTLRAELRLRELLQHLCVLVPVLDADKHYWVGEDEVEKLLRRGKGWLAGHPEREQIAYRYLKQRRRLARAALARLTEEGAPDPEEEAAEHAAEEESVERPLSLAAQRTGAVLAVLRDVEAKRVADLGCGEGRFLRALLDEKAIERLIGMDVSLRALESAGRRLHLDRLAPAKRERVHLLHGSLTYRDRRLEGLDAITLIEVIEHLDSPRLASLARSLFAFAKPRTVIVTTPNIEYNVRFESLPAGRLRHRDHRFEWNRQEFRAWITEVGAQYGYTGRWLGIGPEDPAVGAPTQMGILRRV